MAKLKARGSEIVFRVAKSVPGASERVAEVRLYRALRSDGNLLERMVMRYTPEEVARSYGEKQHDYGWKVRGRVKAGRTLEQLLKTYLDGGWELEEASSTYFRPTGGGIEAVSSEPFISEASAAKRTERLSKSRAKASVEREQHAQVANGPGFYVTNNYVGGVTRSRIADHKSPFATYEEAETFALQRLRRFKEFDFQYLLPVVVIEAESRRAAEQNVGHVWWADGKFKGPPVDPRQTGFGF